MDFQYLRYGCRLTACGLDQLGIAAGQCTCGHPKRIPSAEDTPPQTSMLVHGRSPGFRVIARCRSSQAVQPSDIGGIGYPVTVAGAALALSRVKPETYQIPF